MQFDWWRREEWEQHYRDAAEAAVRNVWENQYAPDMSNTSTQEPPPMVDIVDADLDLPGVPDKPKGCELQEYVAEVYARRLLLEF